MEGTYEVLREFFGDYNIHKLTKAGHFAPSMMDHIHQGFSILKEEGILKPKQKFLDAGSGDGRVMALAMLHGLIPFGVDCDEDLCQKADINLDLLKQNKVLTGAPFKVTSGLFQYDATYERMGVPFSSFDVIFNFYNNAEVIAQKIEEDSPVGKLFLLYLPAMVGQMESSKFTLERKITDAELNSYPNKVVNPFSLEMHAYRKISK